MSHYLFEQGGDVFKLELIPPKDLSDLTINRTLMENDKFSKYHVTATLDGYLFKVSDPPSEESYDFLINCKRKLVKETYEDYLKKKSDIPDSNTKWIYNIVDGVSEQDRILYRDDRFIIIPTYTWHGSVNKLHVLGIVTDKSIKTLRDLDSSHIRLLEDIHQSGLNQIEKHYGVNRDNIRVYLHYPPSTWLLHVHFEVITHVNNSCAVEYCYNLTSVIHNLKLKSDYYQDITMDTYVRCTD